MNGSDGDQDAQAFEALQAVLELWAVLLSEDVFADVDGEIRLVVLPLPPGEGGVRGELVAVAAHR